MKITFLTYIYPYPERGYNPGIERVIGEFSHALANRGHEVNVITTFNRNGGRNKTEADSNVNILRTNDLRNKFGSIGCLFSLDQVSINYYSHEYLGILKNSDIIHTFIPVTGKIPNVPLVSHFHHDENIRYLKEYLYVPANKYFWSKTYRKSDAVISVSSYSARYLLDIGVPEKNIHVLPNSVDTTKFRPTVKPRDLKDRFSGMNILLYVGPITERKGLKYLINAMPAILQENPETILLLVGKGDIPKLKKMAEALGVLNNVIFEGFVPEERLPSYYNACDIFILPSLQEGFGIVLIEAMACGKVAIASNNTAIPEVIGDAGILVESKNSYALAGAISKLLNNTSIRASLELKALERVEKHYSLARVTDQLLNIYNNTINNFRV
jgi:glycosyltransferase involved in cell wall biosynthesis